MAQALGWRRRRQSFPWPTPSTSSSSRPLPPTLVSSHRLDWRSVVGATNNRLKTIIELMGVGAEAKVPVGVLEVKLEILPPFSDEECMTPEVVTTQLALEKSRQMEKERLFLSYSKQWWREFLALRPEHAERIVKIFAQDETGENRPVCSYIKSLRCGRLLDSPRHAARFVSLIPFEKICSFGGSFIEQWYSGMSFLARAKGDVEPHACLLASLLLGFGLDAYVIVGRRKGDPSRPHTWVMTLSGSDVVFWESLTGQTFDHHPLTLGDLESFEKSKPSAHGFTSVGCAFNDRSFFANIQPHDGVDVCSFDFDDESRWKSMSSEVLRSVCSPTEGCPRLAIPPLLPSSRDSTISANDLETQLRVLITEHRNNLGLLTTWDDQLAYSLHPALCAYETDRILGPGASARVNEDFQRAIRHVVPEGFSFKGYPILVLHQNPRRILTTSLRSSDFDDVISCRGDHVALACRVKITFYPEDIAATWVMFACRYKIVL